jgi:type VI secretion system Hcp family effector
VLAVYAMPFFTVSGAHDMFLKLGGIKGESVDADHKDWINLVSTQHGVSRPVESGPGLPRRGGAPSFSELTFTREVDAASPVLFQAAAGGGAIPEAELEVLDHSPLRQRFYRIRLFDVLVSSLTQGATPATVSETVSLNYAKIEMTYTTHDERGAFTSATTAYYSLETAEGGVEIVTPTNLSPTLSPLGDLETLEDTPAVVTLTVDDDLTPLENLTLTAHSSNSQLVPPTGLVIEGSGAVRTLTITPAEDASGSAILTLTLSDGVLTASAAFQVGVLPVNDPPTLSGLAPQVAQAGVPLEVPFSVADVDTPLTAVVALASSADPTLVPASGLVVTGAGADRLLTLTPAAGLSGSTEITLAASDGTDTVQATFSLVVNAADPRAPTAIRLSPAALPENSLPGTVVGVLSAEDPDSTEHSFALLDSAEDRFEIVGNELRAGPVALDYESAAEHFLLVEATDPDQLRFVAQVLVAVENVNEAPVISVTDASLLHVVSGGSLAITRLRVSDVDAGDQPLLLTLDVGQGTLALGGTPAGVVAQGSGTGQLSLSGAVPALSVLLADAAGGVRYSPPPGVSGVDQLTATVSDQGHTGSGGPLAVFTTLGIRFHRDLYARWQFDQFTEAELNDPALEATLWGLNADFDADGLETLAEYGYGSDPRVDDVGSLLRTTFLEQDGQRRLHYAVRRRLDPNLILDVEVADALAGSPWSGDPAALEISAPVDLGNGFEQVSFTDLTPTSEAQQRFMRIRWELR